MAKKKHETLRWTGLAGVLIRKSPTAVELRPAPGGLAPFNVRHAEIGMVAFADRTWDDKPKTGKPFVDIQLDEKVCRERGLL